MNPEPIHTVFEKDKPAFQPRFVGFMSMGSGFAAALHPGMTMSGFTG